MRALAFGAALVVASAAHAQLTCTLRPDLCTRPVTSETNTANLSLAHDVVFVGDGYTAADQAAFAADINAFIAQLKNATTANAIVPHDPTLFNFHRVDVASSTNDLADADTQDTAFGAVATAFDSISYNSAAVLFAAAQNAPDVDTVVLVLNTTAGRANASYSGTHMSGGRLVLPKSSTALSHELGHAMFRLADEYVANTRCYSGGAAGIMSRPNVTVDHSGQRFARAGPPNPQEGAYYDSNCVFRPATSCKMRSNTTAWCPVCARLVQKLILERRNSNDQDEPYVDFTNVDAGMQVSGTFTARGGAADFRGVASLELKIDGTVRQTATGTSLTYAWNTTTAAPGPHLLELRAIDNAGKSDTRSLTVSVLNGADTQPPTVSLLSPAPGATLSGLVTLAAQASDDVAVVSVEFLRDGAVVGTDTTAPYSMTLDSTLVPDGAHTLAARATDAAAKSTTTPAITVTVKNDPVPPTVTLTEPAAPAVVFGWVRLSATASDNRGVAAVDFVVDGVVRATDVTPPYETTWNTASLPGGAHTLLARARDVSGNTADSATVGLTVDGALPTATFVSPAENASVRGKVTVQVSASDDVGVKEVRFLVDNKSAAVDAQAPYELLLDATALAMGEHTVTAVPVDVASREGNPVTRRLVVPDADRAGPTVRIVSPKGGEVKNPVQVTVEVEDESGIKEVVLLANGAEVGRATQAPYQLAVTLPEGNVALWAKAFDTADNASESSAVALTVGGGTLGGSCGCQGGGGTLGALGLVALALLRRRRG